MYYSNEFLIFFHVDFTFLKHFSIFHDCFLFLLGWNEAKMLAHRYRKHFPNIFQDNYDEHKFLFRYTDVHRTEATFKAFTEGKLSSKIGMKQVV